MTTYRQPPFVAICPDCDVECETMEPNEVVAFYRRHYRHTGHDVVVTRADPDADLDDEVADPDDVAAIVDALDARDGDENGVPIGIVVAAMSERGDTVGEALGAIEKVRLTGALYEPRDDHLAAF
ncbi:hypothetical protein [Halosolutus gelatinilyticus]|uniref:hypothetical protein n=1 Tax=Halosolutus gelatinilyticus TaxID=2931975 RepID=UPI001FF693FD|nr:hypothetical protein [Halosolutus gelatinilyticus]